MGPLAAFLFLTPLTEADLAPPADRFLPQRGINTEIWIDWLTLDEMLETPGFLDTYPDYPRHMPAGTLEALAADGFDFIRIAVDPAPLLALAGTPREAALLAQLRLRVEEAQAAGLKVILDLHAWPRGEEYDVDWALADDDNFAAYAAMSARVAARLDGLDPGRTALQLMNEPTQDCDAIYETPEAATWPDRLKLLHDAARAAAPDLPLVLSGACWGGADALVTLDPEMIGDENVLWSLHSYDPFAFTHQSADWTDESVRYFSDLPYPPSALDDPGADRLLEEALDRAAEAGSALGEAELDAVLDDYRAAGDAAVSAPLAAAAAWADRVGVPRHRIVLDEFGAVRLGADGQALDRDAYLRFMEDKRRAAEAEGFGWAIWSWRGNMHVSETPDSFVLDPSLCAALEMPGC